MGQVEGAQQLHGLIELLPARDAQQTGSAALSRLEITMPAGLHAAVRGISQLNQHHANAGVAPPLPPISCGHPQPLRVEKRDASHGTPPHPPLLQAQGTLADTQPVLTRR